MSEGQLKAHESTEEQNLKIVFDRNFEEESVVIDMARQIWVDNFGRAQCQGRSTKIPFRKRAIDVPVDSKLSEKAFLQKEVQRSWGSCCQFGHIHCV